MSLFPPETPDPMSKQTKQIEKQIVDPLAEARERVAALRAKLAGAERAEVAARVALGAVQAADYDDPAAFRRARAAAEKSVADAGADASFFRDHLARAELELRPLEIAEAERLHAEARATRTAEVEALALALDGLPALLAPLAEAIAKARASHASVRSTAAALGKLGAPVPHDGTTEESMLAEKAAATKLDGQASRVLAALVALVEHHDRRGERDRQREQAKVDREHAAHKEWRRRALAGELGPEEMKCAEADLKAEGDRFYGRSPERNVAIGTPRPDPTVTAYRQNAGLGREVP